jgi:hypothetical protein
MPPLWKRTPAPDRPRHGCRSSEIELVSDRCSTRRPGRLHAHLLEMREGVTAAVPYVRQDLCDGSKESSDPGESQVLPELASVPPSPGGVAPRLPSSGGSPGQPSPPPGPVELPSCFERVDARVLGTTKPRSLPVRTAGTSYRYPARTLKKPRSTSPARARHSRLLVDVAPITRPPRSRWGIDGDEGLDRAVDGRSLGSVKVMVLTAPARNALICLSPPGRCS